MGNKINRQHGSHNLTSRDESVGCCWGSKKTKERARQEIGGSGNAAEGFSSGSVGDSLGYAECEDKRDAGGRTEEPGSPDNIRGRVSITCTSVAVGKQSQCEANALIDPVVPLLHDSRGYAVLFGCKRVKIPCQTHVQKETTECMKQQVLNTLKFIRHMLDNDQDPPRAMMLLSKVADSDNGWVNVVISLISFIPASDPLGPAVITLLLDECPLPTREAVQMLYDRLRFRDCSEEGGKHGEQGSKQWKSVVDCSVPIQRNLCVALSCLAEKMAGPSSLWLLTESVLEYLFSNLKPDHSDFSVSLFSLVALEKFSLTNESKELILNRLQQDNRLKALEDFYLMRTASGQDNIQDSNELDQNFYQRQVGFCAQWCLDNLLVLKDRVYTYRSSHNDTSNINVMLNSHDVSEYLKLSPDGLEARCDASLFESVRCTFEVESGIWYYEAEIITEGVMQIGWATKQSKFLNYEGNGIGDDEYSIAYDGCRQLIWYNAKSERHQQGPWKAGDVLGSLLDVDNRHVVFTLNGVALPTRTDLTHSPFLSCGVGQGYFAAASFMSFQQCRFNFGATPFRYPYPEYTPPSSSAAGGSNPPTESESTGERIEVKKFNDFAQLSDDQKMILPRPVKAAELRQMSVREDSCSICADNTANVRLWPCHHQGFCMQCAIQLELCPICRSKISDRRESLTSQSLD